MLKQIKHTLRISLSQRLTAFLAVVAINLFFIIWGAFDPDNLALNIVAVSLSGCALAALIIFQILSDAAIIRNLFKAPEGYAALLTPVRGWKILLSRVIAIVAQDTVGLAVGITGVTYLALILGRVGSRVYQYFDAGTIIYGLVVFIVIYLYIVLAIFFANAMSASVFYKIKGRKLLGVLSALGALYVLSFADLLLAPFGIITSYGSLFIVSLDFGSAAMSTLAFTLISLLKSAALFFATSYLIERKINL